MCDEARRQEIQILLEEYRTLREEVIKRIEIGVSSTSWFGIIGSVILGIGVQYHVEPVFILLPFIIAVLISVDISSRTNVMFLGAHLAELEKRINNLVGKDVLLWEHCMPFARVGADFKLCNAQSNKKIINPLFCRYPVIIIVVSLIYLYSICTGFNYLQQQDIPKVWAWLFISLTSLLFIYLVLMAYIGVAKLPKFYCELLMTEWRSKKI